MHFGAFFLPVKTTMTRRKKTTPSSVIQDNNNGHKDVLSSPFAKARDRMLEVVHQVQQNTCTQSQKQEETKSDPTHLDSNENTHELLAQAYADVKPLNPKDRSIVGAPKHPSQPRVVNEPESALAALSDFVDGKGEFNIEFLDEFITGLAPGVDRHLLQQLKRGDFAVQDFIDLHGFTWAEAREEILSFVRASIRDQKRCILIIHGRGLHSKTPTPALREGLVALLTRGPLRKHILAFSTARPVDGGPGSMYILLRCRRTLTKRQGKSHES